MLVIFLFWIFILLIVVPCGSLVIGFYNKFSKENNLYSFFDTFWLGLASLSIVTVMISLFLPLNVYVLGSIFLLSILYTIFSKDCRNVYQRLLLRIKKLSIFSLVIIALVTFLILILSSAPANSYDMGLYHLQNMIWSEQYSVVPGLANLHGRLAFNPSSLLLSTLFSYHPNHYPVFFPLNGLCMYFLAVYLLTKTDEIKDIAKQSVILISVFFVLFFFMGELSSTSTDILPAIVVIYVIYRFLLDKNNGGQLVCFILPLFCCTLKLSSAPITLLSLWILYTCIKNKEWNKMTFLLVVAVLIVLPWLARYVVLSGYLIYPFSKIDLFSFDWKVPFEDISLEEQVTYAWARIPRRPYHEVLSMPFSDWLPVWFSAKAATFKYLVYLVLLSPLVVLLSAFSKKREIKGYFVWMVAAIGLLFNFFTAPEPRFSYGFLILTAFLPYYLFSLTFKKETFVYYGRVLSVCMIVYFISAQQHILVLDNIAVMPRAIGDLSSKTTFMTDEVNDKKLYVPNETDQCFNFCFPCTPYYKEGLELRGEFLQDGFRIKKTIVE